MAPLKSKRSTDIFISDAPCCLHSQMRFKLISVFIVFYWIKGIWSTSSTSVSCFGIEYNLKFLQWIELGRCRIQYSAVIHVLSNIGNGCSRQNKCTLSCLDVDLMHIKWLVGSWHDHDMHRNVSNQTNQIYLVVSSISCQNSSGPKVRS